MKSAVLQRLESLLQARRLDRTVYQPWPENERPHVASTGLVRLDTTLGGGWRRGEISEIVGPRSSGRTSVLLATVAEATTRGDLVGLVDATDRFDPESASAMGVDLDRVLWVRGPSCTVEAARASLMESAVRQALRAFDLLVRAGGFGIVALDVADVPMRYLRALPFTTWMRLAHANEGRPTVCLIVSESPVGRSARGVSIRLEATGCWTGQSWQSRRLARLDIEHVLLSRS